MGVLRTKDHTVLTLSSAPATSSPAAYGRGDAPEASRAAASARAVKAIEADAAAQGVRATGPRAAVASVMDGLSTVAVAGALSSLPAALGRMRDIAMVSSSGTLTDADRATLQAEYSDLNKQVASVVGSVSTGEKASSSSDKGHDQDSSSHEDAGGASARDHSGPPGTPVHDRAARAKAAVPVSTVAVAASGAAHAAPHAATPRSIAERAASAAKFEQHFAQARSRISLFA
jgi:hypothetical protein